MRHLAPAAVALLTALSLPTRAADDAEPGFVSLFNGNDLTGWKVAERPDSFKVENGAIVAHGDRAHCFYVGEGAPFKNFELKVDVLTKPHSNGGIYFHTQFQPEGWPSAGFETQVNNTYDPDPKKTGSLYNIQNVMNVSPAKDNQWWTQHVIVQGDTVTIKIDGKTVTQWTQPRDAEKKLSSGTFALQAHDPKSVVHYRNIRVKRLD